MTQEQEIKQFLFPYGSFIRLTPLDRIRDVKSPVDESQPSIEDTTDWRPLATVCTYQENE